MVPGEEEGVCDTRGRGGGVWYLRKRRVCVVPEEEEGVCGT